MSTAENNIESIVAEAVKAKVQVLISEALGEPGVLVNQIVTQALTMNVKNKEYPYKDEPMIHRITRKAIAEEAETVMREFIDEQRGAIRAELKRHLTNKKSDIAEALIDSLVTMAGNSYSLRLTFVEKP